jgi:hypothetical protein
MTKTLISIKPVSLNYEIIDLFRNLVIDICLIFVSYNLLF